MRKPAAAVASVAAGLVAVVALHTLHDAPRIGALPPPSTTGRPSSRTGPTSSVPTSPPPSTVAGAVSTALGTNEQYGYGVLSVKVTVKGRHIEDVAVANLQTAESYSQSLAQQVIPMLRNEVLTAQNAQVNTISGATYTSEAYLYSLQAALDKLHV